MFESLLNQPQLIILSAQAQLTLTLSAEIGDHSVLQTLGGHIAEFVVAEAVEGIQLIVRVHPYLTLTSQALTEHKNTDHKVFGLPSLRTLGQGVRLFSGIGYAPSTCVQALRQGLTLHLECQPKGGVVFTPVFGLQWQCIELEKDLRLFSEPKVLCRAKGILARRVDLILDAQDYLLEINELELCRNELKFFVGPNSIITHSELIAKVDGLDAQLSQRQQLMTRLYHQLLERPNWRDSANQGDEFDGLQRRLDAYQLLAPIELNTLVEQLFIDDDE